MTKINEIWEEILNFWYNSGILPDDDHIFQIYYKNRLAIIRENWKVLLSVVQGVATFVMTLYLFWNGDNLFRRIIGL